MSDAGFPLPPPTFEFLVFSLKMQAEMRLGLFGFGSEEEKEEGPDLPSARHAIDLLGMLQEKTRGNLSMEEQRLIENSLTELRFRFVQVSEDAAKAAAAKKAEPQSQAAESPAESSSETSSSETSA